MLFTQCRSRIKAGKKVFSEGLIINILGFVSEVAAQLCSLAKQPDSRKKQRGSLPGTPHRNSERQGLDCSVSFSSPGLEIRVQVALTLPCGLPQQPGS